jgi:hypothetical protein
LGNLKKRDSLKHINGKIILKRRAKKVGNDIGHGLRIETSRLLL